MPDITLESWVMLAMIAGMGFALGFINHRCGYYKKEYKRLESQHVDALRRLMDAQTLAMGHRTRIIQNGLEEILRQADKEIVETIKRVTCKPDGETETDDEASISSNNH